MRLTKFKTTYILMAVAIAALSLALTLLASNTQGAHAGVAASAASPTPTATPSPTETASPAATPVPIQVNASQAEFSVTSDPAGVPTGSAQFNVTNNGANAHEFVIMQTDNPPNALLYDDTTKKAVEDAPGQQDVGEVAARFRSSCPVRRRVAPSTWHLGGTCFFATFQVTTSPACTPLSPSAP